jgi:hypothetical protein
VPRWRSWDERRREIQQELAFAAAGIGDLVLTSENLESSFASVNLDCDEDDVPLCAECGEPSPCAFERAHA